MSNEVMENVKFNVAVNGEKSMALMEELEGLGGPSFEFIKMPSGGGLVFEVPGIDAENPDMEKEITGVIVDHHPINAYWIEKYAGGNEKPDCQSMDGKQGIGADGCIHDCASCVQNQFGSDGSGKSCKNMHRIYLLRSGEMLPMILTVPPTSLKGVKDYIQNIFIKRGLRPIEALTKISLKKDTNNDGIAYSKATFSLQDTLDGDSAAMVKEYAEGLKKVSRQVTFNNDEYAIDSKTIAENGTIVDVGDNELPFKKGSTEYQEPVYEEYTGDDYSNDYQEGITAE